MTGSTLRLVMAGLLGVCAITVFAQEPAPAGPPFDAAAVDANIRAALATRIDTAKVGVGMVVGIVTPEGRQYLAHGRTDKTGGTPVGPDTVFEIGSLTKLFTSLLLADMVERGEVSLDEEVARYLPDGVTMPRRNGRAITLADLATHTSGLPRLPANLVANDLVNPYATYGAAQLHAFLSGYTLPRDPGEQWEYSNLGGGLLGHVLARRAGTSYEAVVKTRILEPLGMKDTTIALSADQRARLSAGYDMVLSPAGLWDFDALAGAGALRSTASDMLTFATAQLGLVPHPLEAAMRRMVSISRPAGGPAMEQHLGWLRMRGLVLFHDGGTNGHRSALALRPDLRRGVVVLSNTFQDVNDVALHGVVQQSMLATFEQPTAIALAEDVIETYVGVYELSPDLSIEISRSGTQVFAQATHQPRTELAAQAEGQFFDPTNPSVRITFVKDAAGAVTGLTIQLGGANLPARRIR